MNVIPLATTSNRPPLLMAALLVGVLVAGCGAESDAEFRISGIQQFDECLSKASPIQPEMMASRQRVNTIGVFLQTTYPLPSAADTVYFEIYQPELIRQNLGQPFELADPIELFVGEEEFDEPPVLRGQILFGETCPEVTETFALRGTVVFEELSAEDGQFVTGELIDGQIVSTRDESVVADQIEGSWQFEVQQGRPNDYYPTYRDEIPRGPEP